MKMQLFSGKAPARSNSTDAIDAKNFMALYRAYMCGAADQRQSAEQDQSFKMAVAAMIFALVSWAVTLYLVFK